MQRQLKKEVKIGNIKIGGTNPIAVQTMLNVPVKDIAGNVAQAERVAKAGCQIVRVTVPTPADAAVVAAIKEKVDIPVVADIHFDYRAALAALDAGADKIRINPGNIGDDDRVKAVADACNARNVPIRIGVNGGSLEKHILAKYGAPVPEAMVESAMYHVRLLQKYDFDNIVISIKSSNVPRMMAAYRLLASQTDYPLHVGVTEAGGNRMGLIKSGMGIGGLLMEGIGDTLRVSLTDEPENEVYAGYDILRAAGYAVKSVFDIIANDNETETVVYTSPEFQPCADTFSEKYHFVGPLLRPAQSSFEKLPGRSLIYISLGTVNNDALPFYRACLAAFGGDPRFQLVLSAGTQADLAALGPIPENCTVRASVDQMAVLDCADVFLTHCGMNSASEGLWHGLPLVLYPQTPEQHGVANRVAALGAGVPLTAPSADGIRRAVETALTDPAYRENAQKLADGFHRCGGAAEAADAIEHAAN